MSNTANKIRLFVGVEGNGMMSGTGGDDVNTQVNGNAVVRNDTQDLLMNQYGHAEGPGSASMVGAGSLQTYSYDNKSKLTIHHSSAFVVIQ